MLSTGNSLAFDCSKDIWERMYKRQWIDDLGRIIKRRIVTPYRSLIERISPDIPNFFSEM